MKKKLEMTQYQLEIPTNYKSIDIGEMQYINGGYRPSRSVYINPGSRRLTTTEFCTEAGAVATISIAIVTKVASIVSPATAFITGVSSGIWKAALAGAIGITIAAKADSLDAKDGSRDGMITLTWGGRYATEYNPYPPNSYQGAMF